MPPTLLSEMPATPKAATEFGKRLVAIRKLRGVTQTQLAEAIGYREPTPAGVMA